MLLLLMGGTAPAAPQDTLGMCSDYSIVINDEHLPWLTKHMLTQDDSVMIELLADREVHLRGEELQLFAGYLNERVEALISLCNVTP